MLGLYIYNFSFTFSHQMVNAHIRAHTFLCDGNTHYNMTIMRTQCITDRSHAKARDRRVRTPLIRVYARSRDD